MARKSAGRRRLEMKKIEKEAALQVTFSKRRSGLFKKASELAILCGADVLIVVFSPAGRPYTFGSPDVETIAQRFLTGDTMRPSFDVGLYGSTTRGVMLRQKVREYTDMVEARDMRQARLQELKKMVRESRALDVESLEAEELHRVLGSMLELRCRLTSHLHHLDYLNHSLTFHNPIPQLPVPPAPPTMMPPRVTAAGRDVDRGVPGAHPRRHATNSILDCYGGTNPAGVVLGHRRRHADPSPAHAAGVSMGLFNAGLR